MECYESVSIVITYADDMLTKTSHPSQFQPESHQRFKRRKTGKASGKEQLSSVAKDEEAVNESLEIDPEELANEGE